MTASLGVPRRCSRRPARSFQNRLLHELVGRGQATALIFGTPAHRRNAYCGLMLDRLVAEADGFRSKVVNLAANEDVAIVFTATDAAHDVTVGGAA